jgi:hypothetical protein
MWRLYSSAASISQETRRLHRTPALYDTHIKRLSRLLRGEKPYRNERGEDKLRMSTDGTRC